MSREIEQTKKTRASGFEIRSLRYNYYFFYFFFIVCVVEKKCSNSPLPEVSKARCTSPNPSPAPTFSSFILRAKNILKNISIIRFSSSSLLKGKKKVRKQNIRFAALRLQSRLSLDRTKTAMTTRKTTTTSSSIATFLFFHTPVSFLVVWFCFGFHFDVAPQSPLVCTPYTFSCVWVCVCVCVNLGLKEKYFFVFWSCGILR